MNLGRMQRGLTWGKEDTFPRLIVGANVSACGSWRLSFFQLSFLSCMVCELLPQTWASTVAQMVRNVPAMHKTLVRSSHPCVCVCVCVCVCGVCVSVCLFPRRRKPAVLSDVFCLCNHQSWFTEAALGPSSFWLQIASGLSP